LKLTEKIGKKYATMTTNEKKIYALMMDDVKSFSLMSIGVVAQKLDISKTTLMRFAKSAGFKGYSDFKKALQEEELLNLFPADKMKKIIRNDTQISADQIHMMELNNIQKTYDDIMDKDLDSLVDALVNAKTIYTMGWGPTHHAADILSMRMKLMGLESHRLKKDNGTLIDEAARLKASDILVVFEIPPYVHESLAAARAAAKNNTPIVLVANSPQCPIAEVASHTYYCPTEAILFGNSLLSFIFWINLISSQVIYRLKSQVMGFLEKQRELFKDDRYFIQ